MAILLILGGIFRIHTASAQDAGKVEIIAINSADFPALQVQFEVFDGQNRFIRDLQTGQVQILENGEACQPAALELLQPGVHFTMAYNLGPELSNRYASVSRFEALQAALINWAQSQPAATSDQFSLAANTGLQLIRSEDPREWVNALKEYQPDLLAESPSLNSLTRAVDLATDANPDSQRKNVILFITPLFFTWNQEAATNLAGRAAAQGVRINVWLVASDSAATNNPQITQGLEALAAETGGQYHVYDGQTDLPNPEDYLEPLRYAYRAAYVSQINATGTHDLQVEIDNAGSLLTSASKPLFLNVEPPNPIFLSPPTLIERKWIKEEGQKDSQLLPDAMLLRIVVEFPDGHVRPLKFSRLYVDGALANENTAEPFD